MTIKRSQTLSILLIFAVLAIVAISTPPQFTAPVNAAEDSDADTHVAITVSPNHELTVTTWLNTMLPENVMNGTTQASLQIGDKSAALNVSLALEDALGSMYPFNVTELQVALDLQESEARAMLDLWTTAPSDQLLREVLRDDTLVDLFELLLNSTDLALDVDLQSNQVQIMMETTVTANLTALLSEAMGIPFTITTPLLMNFDYADSQYSGNLTVVVVPGLPLDITLNLAGNTSDFCLTGNLYVPYGSYPEIGPVNQTTLDEVEQYLEEIFPAPITIDGSLQNLTAGALSSLKSTIDREVIYDGEYLNFTLCIHATSSDLFATLANTLMLVDAGINADADFLMNPTHALDNATFALQYLPDRPELTVQFAGAWAGLDLPLDALLPILFEALELPSTDLLPDSFNTTGPHVQSARFVVDYRAADQRLHLQLSGTLIDFSSISLVSRGVSELLPPSIGTIIEDPNANLTDIDLTLTYAHEELEVALTVEWDGDMNSDLNALKNAFVEQVSELPFTLVTESLQATNVNVTGLIMNLHLENTTLSGILDNLHLTPPIDASTATTFQLDTFFNATSTILENSSIPQVTVMGGSNGTHTVTLIPDKATPPPHTILQNPENHTLLMTWTNLTLADLRNLTFHIIEGIHYTEIFLNPAFISTSTPHLIDAKATLNTQLIITAISNPMALTLSPITAHDLALPSSEAFKLVAPPINIAATMVPNALSYTLKMSYTDQQVEDAGVDEGSLTIHNWNPATQSWQPVSTSTVDTNTNVVHATLTHFSVFALMGTVSPLWTQSWFLLVLASGILGLGTILGVRYRRHNTRERV